MYGSAEKAAGVAIAGTAMTGFSWFAQLPIWSALSCVLSIAASVTAAILLRHEKNLALERQAAIEETLAELSESVDRLAEVLVLTQSPWNPPTPSENPKESA